MTRAKVKLSKNEVLGLLNDLLRDAIQESKKYNDFPVLRSYHMGKAEGLEVCKKLIEENL